MSGSALRVYLKIIRNVLGWRDEQGKVKNRDWISHSQFEKTGLSNRSVTNGIQELLDKNLIQVTDHTGNSLQDPVRRKTAKRVYYSPVLENAEKTAFYNAKTKENDCNSYGLQKKFNTKAYTATYEQKGKLTDRQRYEQIKLQQQRKQLQRDSWNY
ncbi:hypothetical protein [Winogradskyella haliclonae]|uniref:hypothetical protein n=1 Tax=Winogradskyella haliclonae TaxID=2048558 RepID=UPI0016693243|nr:hypothetical protein [Winogradskyella haliclonae]